jgi:hypothetical protein
LTQIPFDFEGEWYEVWGQGIWPLDWHPYGDPARTCEGGHPDPNDPHLAHLVKTGMRSLGYEKVWDTHRGGGLTVVDTQPGDEIVFSMFGRYIFQADPGVQVSPIHMRIGIDPEGGINPDAQSVIWSEEQEIAVNGFDDPIEWTHFGIFAIAESTRATLFLFTNPTSAGARHSGPVWDDGRVTITTPEPPEPPDDCWGLPRIDYARTVNVVVDKRAAEAVLEATWPQTISNSYDDAGIGQLSNRNAVLWDIPLPMRESYLDFYAEWYPGVNVTFRSTGMEPPEPTGPHLEYIAPHMQTRDSDEAVAVFLRQKHPRGWKGFSAQDCLWAHLIALEGGWPMWIDYRKHFEPQDLSSSPETIARYICDAYEGDINQYGHAIDSIEGFNEIMDSSVEVVKRAVAIELAFMKEVDRRGWPVRACVHNTGVGNPHESQVHLMLPMAEYAAEHGHILGLHSYGGADREQSYLVSDFDYHAGRFTKQDEIFVQHGIKVRWFLSEAGPIRAGPRQADGYLPMPDPEAGWRHSTCMNGDWSRAFEFWSTYTAMLHAWNLENEDRVIAASAFTTCSEAEDWEGWRYKSPQWLYLANH